MSKVSKGRRKECTAVDFEDLDIDIDRAAWVEVEEENGLERRLERRGELDSSSAKSQVSMRSLEFARPADSSAGRRL